jgi:DNA-binding phage protein
MTNFYESKNNFHSLSPEGNPESPTVVKGIKALGLRQHAAHA